MGLGFFGGIPISGLICHKAFMAIKELKLMLQKENTRGISIPMELLQFGQRVPWIFQITDMYKIALHRCKDAYRKTFTRNCHAPGPMECANDNDSIVAMEPYISLNVHPGNLCSMELQKRQLIQW